jgi:hypothetical protein
VDAARADRTADDVTASLARWIDALNHPRDRARLLAAITPDARVERHDALAREAIAPAPAEVLDGVAAIARWLGRLQRETIFALVGAPAAGDDGATWTIEYALRVPELAFDNGGLWVVRLADDGRLAHVSHRPFPLAAKWQQP